MGASEHPAERDPCIFIVIRTTNAGRAVMTAAHPGMAATLVTVDLAKGEHRQPQSVKLNPNHKVPVLKDDGFILWESHAIMQYLCDITPLQTIAPSAKRARADVNGWRFWCAQRFVWAARASTGSIGSRDCSDRIRGRFSPSPIRPRF